MVMGTFTEIVLNTSVAVATTSFLLYWFISHSNWYKQLLSRLFPIQHINRYFPFYQKGLGVLLIGVFPLIIMLILQTQTHYPSGLILSNLSSSALWFAGLGAVLTGVPYLSARKPKMQAYYPQVREPIWSPRLIAINIGVWAIYLLAYEFLFRSFLLHGMLASVDAVSAIVITTAISVATHMPKGAAETFGTIPFSVVLCIIAINTGSIWAGLFIHLALALSNDFWAIRFNPNIEFSRKNTLANQR